MTSTPLDLRADPVAEHFRGCRHEGRGPLCNLPNAVTAVRTVLSLTSSAAGILGGSLGWLALALAVYWIGDIADGAIARRLRQETTAGAVFDIVCDRVCGACFFLGMAALDPATAPVVVLFLAEFMVLDLLLSLAFFLFPVNSPNYFGRVDRRVFRLNWSKVAKSLNSGLVAVLLFTPVSTWVPAAIAVALIGVKSYSLVRTRSLPRRPDVDCVDTYVRAVSP
ncbi:CDP-alcohol phosphatidyltransferase family protein [Kineococcus sp. SYSU DK001]|uniref:CDP-alcohol phosphatidyltransferase family protein n=1 Tax=Kineococcus sp. SYSU DK001 TaxID=3383122 RepID=UPI003D7C601B